MFLALEIENSNFFYPGQIIAGVAFCVQPESGNLDVNIRMIGVEYTRPFNIVPTKKIRINRFLQTERVNIQSGILDGGAHRFPFKLTLPSGIPSSYNGLYGHVKYFVEADLKTDFSEKRDKLEFEVFSPINLEEVPNVSLFPSVHSDGLVIEKWFCIPEIISMDVTLEKNAFVVGEVIDVEVTLKNFSNLKVSGVTTKVYLKTIVKASTTDQLPIIYQLLCSDEKLGIGSYKTKIYTFQLTIPNDARITNLQKCQLFTQKAFLEVTAMFMHCPKRNLKVNVELALGHYSPGRQVQRVESRGISPPAYDIVCGPSPDASNVPTINPVRQTASQNSSPVRLYNTPSVRFATNRTEGEHNDSANSSGTRSLPKPNEIDFPYPTTDPIPLAPPIPLPSETPSVVRGRIGFVPTSVAVDSAHSSDDRPSSPLLSEIAAAPTVSIEELPEEIPQEPPSYEEACRLSKGEKKEGRRREMAMEARPT